MKQHNQLKRFEYCILDPGAAANGMKKISIDFEKGQLSVTGDIGLIEVWATIYPGLTGGLAGFSADELIFSLDGTIRDSKHINSCSGLLVLEHLTNGRSSEGREWHATLYLYDDNSDGREIKLRLTMYCPSANPQLN